MTNKTKKAQGITMNTVVIAVLAILVLVTLAIIFSGKLFKFGQKTEEIETSAGNLDAATCQLKCNTFNQQCILVYQKDGQTKYKVLNNNFCNNLHDELVKCNMFNIGNLNQEYDKAENAQCRNR